MQERHKIIDSLSYSPSILLGLIENVPEELLRSARMPGKWSIHEHACHISQAETMILNRFRVFHEVQNPTFEPYLPGTNVETTGLLQLDLEAELRSFKSTREELVRLVSSFEPEHWNNEGNHSEYYRYNPEILLRHTLMHDHFHMYRIEELWLTKEEFLK